jgi:hypothetical protein
MSHEGMAFNAASIATILWADRGFEPVPDIVEVGENLKKHLSEINIVDKICKTFGIDKSTIIDPATQLDFDAAPGKERIRIAVFRDVEIDSVKIQELTLRIHVCNRNLKMKSKVTAFANVLLENRPNAERAAKIINSVFNIERKICRYIFGYINDAFSLGNVNYIGNIASIESGEKDIDTLIETVSADSISQNAVDGENKRIIDLYHVLLANDLITINQSLDRKSLLETLKKHEIKENRIKMYQSRVAIPVKAVNYELSNLSPINRIITVLTRMRCGKSIALCLFYDYLGMT